MNLLQHTVKTLFPDYTGPVAFDKNKKPLVTPVAMKIAKELGLPPRTVAAKIANELNNLPDWPNTYEVSGPGFITECPFKVGAD